MAPASREELEAERKCWEHRRNVEELQADVIVLRATQKTQADQIAEIGRQRAEERARADANELTRKASTQTRMWIAASILLPILLKAAELIWSSP